MVVNSTVCSGHSYNVHFEGHFTRECQMIVKMENMELNIGTINQKGHNASEKRKCIMSQDYEVKVGLGICCSCFYIKVVSSLLYGSIIRIQRP